MKVRFAPSPTGDLHVGNIRTALFDWAYARHTGGTFLFRIEDTDTTRVTDEYINAAIDTLKWLGLDWDEGPEVGGDNGPYLQSMRLDIYAHWAATFIEQKDAYHCYCSPVELEAVREAQRAANQAPGYNGHCRDLTLDQIEEYKTEGRIPVVRMRMPDGKTTFNDLIRGEMEFDHKFVPDFVLVRGDGSPLYTLAVAVDDVLMKVTHILRGEDLLSSTPRQIRVYQAMGVALEEYPIFAHLPFVMGADNAKLSKRNGEVSIAWYRDKGFLPEAICNYLALLGWSPGDNREDLTMTELCELFTVEKVNSSPAKFDMKKLEAINGDKIRALTIDEFLKWSLPFLIKAKVISGTPDEVALVKAALPIIQERIVMFSEIPAMLKFLFVKKVDFTETASAVVSNPNSHDLFKRVAAIIMEISAEEWKSNVIEERLRDSLVVELGLKPRVAFQFVRAIITGDTISPPLFESMELLGREECINRIATVQS